MSGSKPIDVNITGERHLFGLLGVTCTFTATFTDDHSPVCPPITITTLTVGQAKRAILPILVGTAIQRRTNMGTPIDMSGIPMGEDTAAWALERARRWWHTHDWDDDAMNQAEAATRRDEPSRKAGWRIDDGPDGARVTVTGTDGHGITLDPATTASLRDGLNGHREGDAR